MTCHNPLPGSRARSPSIPSLTVNCILDATDGSNGAGLPAKRKFRFLYLLLPQSMLSCIYSGERGGSGAADRAGSKLRHWPPGTSSSTVRAVFFCLSILAPSSRISPPPGTTSRKRNISLRLFPSTVGDLPARADAGPVADHCSVSANVVSGPVAGGHGKSALQPHPPGVYTRVGYLAASCARFGLNLR
jgi:hypothetical protein